MRIDDALGRWDLTFRRWREGKEHQRSDWTMVARLEKQDPLSIGSFSVLVPNEPGVIDKIFSVWDWQFHMDTIGRPGFFRNRGSDTVDLDLGRSAESAGVPFEPLVIYRYFHGVSPEKFDLVQDFVLLYNLYDAVDSGVMRTLLSDGNEEDVVRVIEEAKSIRMLVATHYLRDYLAARRRVLVRYHDHTWWSEDVELDREKPREFQFQDDSSFYHVWIGEGFLGRGLVANLRGKDVVQPFSEPLHREYQELKGTLAREHERFMVGVDDNGRPVELEANPDSDTYLKLVFFRKQVLQKYYDQATKYQVGPSRVTCLDLWSIPIDTNQVGLVYAYLGDIGRLPISEQRHWKAHNVSPAGGMTSHRFMTDFEAEFVEDVDPVSRFKRSLAGLMAASSRGLGFALIRELRPEDQHALRSLHVPLTEEWAEFDAQVQYLAKATVDSIDARKLTLEVRGVSTSAKPREIKSLDALEQYLQAQGVLEAHEYVEPLRRIQHIRSASAAHRKGSEFYRVFRRLGLESSTAAERFIFLLDGATSALERVTQALAPPKDDSPP